MKELALLMFFVGCGYALAKLIERFSPADGRRIFLPFLLRPLSMFFGDLFFTSALPHSSSTTTIGSACFSL